jgi:hypothetical protein
VEERQDALPQANNYELLLEKRRQVLRDPRRQELLLEEWRQILCSLHEADGQVLLDEWYQTLLTSEGCSPKAISHQKSAGFYTNITKPHAHTLPVWSTKK